MTLLNQLYQLSEATTSNLDRLPQDCMKGIQKNIRDGAEDIKLDWANALELVHKAYEVEGIQRPTPDMKNAWKQYEENLTYAVQQLGKARGMNADWRMSAAIFTEAFERKHKFRVTESSPTQSETHIVVASGIDEILKTLTEKTRNFDIDIKKSENPENPYAANITFSKWGIKQNYHLRIQRVF